MDEPKVSSQLTPHICACCLTKDCFKDLKTEYTWMEQKEIYEDMLYFTFDIPVHTDLAPQLSICEICVKRLRDASNFKKQVLESQKQLVLFVNSLNLKSEQGVIDVSPAKAEYVERSDYEYLACEEPTDTAEVKEESVQLVELTLRKPVTPSQDHGPAAVSVTKRGLPKAISDSLDFSNTIAKVKHLSKVVLKRNNSKDKTEKESGTSTVIESQHESITTDKQPRPRSDMPMKKTSLILLENSNITLFRWYKNKYKCFCCDEVSLHWKTLKVHCITHTIDEIKQRVLRFNSKYYFKAEVSDLKCSVCNKTIDNLKELQPHIATHVNLSPEHLLVPYKLNEEFTCQVCTETFQTFVILDRHMNLHYSRYICEICGKGFKSKTAITTHSRRHDKRPVTCKTCDVTFVNYYQKRQHDIATHKRTSGNICPHCPDKFSSYQARLMHLVKVHGEKKPEFKCDICHMSYYNNSLLTSHIRRQHLKVRNATCPICAKTFFRQTDLNSHMKCHSAKKDFECGFCGKAFKTSRHLRRHLPIHVEGMRHVCGVCGRTFTQKYNLQLHEKQHLVEEGDS